MGFKNLKKYVFTWWKFKVVWQLVPQSWSWCSIGFLSVHCCSFLVPSQVNRTQIRAFLLVYIFWSDHLIYSGAVPLSILNARNRILYSDLRRTGSQCSWNKTAVICSLFVHVTRHSSALAVGGLSERERESRILYSNALP